MFTGIIREMGKISAVTEKNGLLTFSVIAPESTKDKKNDESIAVNGICVTITSIKNKEFTFDLMEESVDKSNLGDLKENDLVNLEPALKLNQSLDGHLVQGHVDTTTKVTKIEKTTSQNKVTFKIPEKISKYLALKGSITINGVSMTICDLNQDTFTVALIPHTIENTNLGKLKEGDEVNLEVDVIARYLERLINRKQFSNQ